MRSVAEDGRHREDCLEDFVPEAQGLSLGK